MKDFKNYTFLIVPYLTFSGALFHISYWDAFGLNGLSFISISDIIKSSVQPTYKVISTTIFNSFIYYFIFNFNDSIEPGRGSNTKAGKALNSQIGISISLGIWASFQYCFFLFNTNPYYWNIWAGITSMPFFILFYNLKSIKELIPEYKFRIIIVQIVLYFPIYSFAIGKEESWEVLKNYKYKYSLTQFNKELNTKTIDTLKFIGASSQYFIFTDLKNENILIKKNIDKLILKIKD